MLHPLQTAIIRIACRDISPANAIHLLESLDAELAPAGMDAALRVVSTNGAPAAYEWFIIAGSRQVAMNRDLVRRTKALARELEAEMGW